MSDIDEMEMLAIEYGVRVECVNLPIHMRFTADGKEENARFFPMKAVRVISLESFLDSWDRDYTLFLYKVYLAPADELITIRYAKDSITDVEFAALV